MKMYDVNEKIEELVARLEPEAETGVSPASEKEIAEAIGELDMDMGEVLENLAKLYMNTKGELEECKLNETRLKEKCKRIEQKKSSLVEILKEVCGGKKTPLGIATLCRRKEKSVEIRDSDAVFRWLRQTGHPECYRIRKPEIIKEKVGALLEKGEKIPGAELVYTMQYTVE